VDVRGADRIVVPPFGSTAALSTASSGRALLPQSSNDLTLFFELRLIDFVAGISGRRKSAKLRRDGPMRAVAAFEFRSRGGALFSMREYTII
jgi:hypothetical protein